MDPKSNLAYPKPHRQQGPQRLLSEAIPARPISMSPAPYQQSQSPFRYVHFDEVTINEKSRVDETPLDTFPGPKREGDTTDLSPSRIPSSHPARHTHSSSPGPSSSHQHNASPSYRVPSPCPSTPTLNFAYPQPSLHSDYAHPRRLRLHSLIKPWIPLILYLLTSLGFLVAIAFWKEEVFQGLDDLSSWLKSDEHFGYAVLFFLIFLTTFPPIPLYSTLIILSGYTFGPWTGAIISYWAALTGALVVFILSRYFFRDAISRWLSCTVSIKRVVRAIEKRPKLLFLIRLAPYPYNVMNCLLAASPTLTLQTYTTCTALSLFKVIIHTTLGSSIHSFAEYHVKPRPDASIPANSTTPANSSDPELEEESTLGHYSTIAGIVLCIGIVIYISYVARKAVDDELEDDEVLPTHTDEEVTAFLSPAAGRPSDNDDADGPMSESPFRAATPTYAAATLSGSEPSRPSWSPQRNSNGRLGYVPEPHTFGGGREETDIRLH